MRQFIHSYSLRHKAALSGRSSIYLHIQKTINIKLEFLC
jgi:hypothetical protein